MKRFLFTLLAVLAVTACRNAEMDTLSNPAETGVRIIVGRGERTVTPDANGLYYTLELTATDKEPLHAVIAESETSTTVNLTPGTWRLDIEGYLNADAAADESVQPVVQGAVSNIAVTGGVMTNVTVALETTTQADDGTGIFEYTVSFPDSVNSAELTITRYGEDQGQTFNLKDGGGGPKTVELAAGYYRIAVALDYGEKQVRQRDIVHIVNKLTTTASYTYTVDNFAEPTEESEEDDEPISIGVNITKSIGWFNVAAIEWDTLNIADSYEVYYKKTSDSVYTKADDPLIRNYGSYYRADVMGIAAGSYNIKVRPVLQETAEGFIAIDEERIVSVESHDRSGYAFANGKVPGAYKLDGTPKDNARVIYVTNANKDTVALDVNVDGKGDKTQTGLQTIIDGHKKGNETRPLIIRLIGQIKTGDWTSSYAGDMMFETKNDADTYITLEGVGDDATADGWGVRM
ncbi:MAG: membrane lipoprotein lipid attachment site-containing protein, partial [Treponema sp.]|nr:membrane lipoprotein lipid attachment site-containing protein [Treponema sp.]